MEEEKKALFGQDVKSPDYLDLINGRYDEVKYLEASYKEHISQGQEEEQAILNILDNLYISKADVIYFLAYWRMQTIKELIRIQAKEFETVSVVKLNELSKKAESGTIDPQEVIKERENVQKKAQKIFDEGKYPLISNESLDEANESLKLAKKIFERLIWSIDLGYFKGELRELRGGRLLNSLMEEIDRTDNPGISEK